jgi:hypothetical protein
MLALEKISGNAMGGGDIPNMIQNKRITPHGWQK